MVDLRFDLQNITVTSIRGEEPAEEAAENQNQENNATEEVANETPTIPDSQNHYG
ncbi:MAG: hypothetical protein KG003_03080 [Bacteroidetes bacterium]|nr:hypothetical protein [Bacteroidota bacterium]